jgi:hypothetical protein
MKRRRKKILGLPIGPRRPSVAGRLARPVIAVAGLGALAVATGRLGQRSNGNAQEGQRSGASAAIGRGSRPGADPSVEARSARTDVQRHLKSGELSLDDVFQRADADEAIARTRVKVLLQNLPGVGSRGAVTAMEELGIAANRRLGGLGSRQRGELLDRFAGSVTSGG